MENSNIIKPTAFRWVVYALLFLAATVNCLGRQALFAPDSHYGVATGYMMVFCSCLVAYLFGRSCMGALVPHCMKAEI